MRLAILADVHANLVALEAVVAEGRARDVDGWLCAGDVVGYGPQPDACVAAVRDLGAVTVAGNHDLIAIGRLDASQCTAFAADSLRWTGEVLSAPSRAWLGELPPVVTADGGIVMAHGSLDDPREYVDDPAAGAAQLALLAERFPQARMLVLGHTHRPALLDAAGRTLLDGRTGTVSLPGQGPVLLNPGSAGQPRGTDPRARLAIVDVDRWEVELVAVPWDLDGNRRALRAAGRPETSNWAPPPTPWARVVRAVRRRVLPALGSLSPRASRRGDRGPAPRRRR